MLVVVLKLSSFQITGSTWFSVTNLYSALLMLSSHLPRTPCEKFVYNFPCGFGGIVHVGG